jgi:phosphoglycerate dehydrogenase-like enzyme
MSGTGQHVIAHHFDARVTRLLSARWPRFPIVEVDPTRAWSLPPTVSVLLSGPSRVWAGAPAQLPQDWPRALKWVQIPGAGADLYPRWLLDHHVVTTGRGINSVAIAEFALASILAQAKRFPSAWITRRDDWRTVQMDTLDGATLGLLGFGSVARQVAQRARPFGMRIMVYRRSNAEPMPDGIVRAESFAHVLAKADHLVLAAPHTPATHHIINRLTIGQMKPGVHLVNIARGGLVDQDALLAGLESGQVGAASLDVTDPEPLPPGHPLYTHERVRLSPHVAWNSPDTLDRLVDKFNLNLARLIDDQPLIDVLEE